MKIELKRGAPIDFEFEDASGRKWTATIPAITVGQYRRAVALETDHAHRAPCEVLHDQALILCGHQNADFVAALDPEQLGECIQALIAVYCGMRPDEMIEVMRTLKKKSLLQTLFAATPAQPSENSTG